MREIGTERSAIWPGAAILLVLLIGLGVSFFTARSFETDSLTDQRKNAMATAAQLTDQLNMTLHRLSSSLRAMGSVFHGSSSVHQGEFETAVEVVRDWRAPLDFAAFAYARRFNRLSREEWQRLRGAEIRSLHGAAQPVDALAESFIVELTSNENPLLDRYVDLATHGYIRAAAASAARVPQEVIMGPAFQQDGIWWSALAFHVPNGMNEGVLVGLLNLNNLFDELESALPDGLRLRLRQHETAWGDHGFGEQVVLGTPLPADDVTDTITLRIAHGQASWSLDWDVLPEFGSTSGWGAGNTVLVAGGLLTLLVAFLVGAMIQRDSAIRREVRRRTAELAQARDEAEMANRTKTEFLATMSHELRTPLNAVLGFSEVMRDELLGPLGQPHYKEYARDIYNSGSHLLSVINDILDVAKAEAGRLELYEEQIDLSLVAHACVQLVQGRAEEADVSIETSVPLDMPLLTADMKRLKQILLNLLSNAVKFTPAGGKVGLDAKLRKDGGIDLIVHDTGIGIAKHDLERALQPFGQIDSHLSRKYEGTGLGLPLSRNLAELHGATLSIESEPNKGTVVTVRFPPQRSVRMRQAA